MRKFKSHCLHFHQSFNACRSIFFIVFLSLKPVIENCKNMAILNKLKENNYRFYVSREPFFPNSQNKKAHLYLLWWETGPENMLLLWSEVSQICEEVKYTCDMILLGTHCADLWLSWELLLFKTATRHGFWTLKLYKSVISMMIKKKKRSEQDCSKSQFKSSESTLSFLELEPKVGVT